MRAHVLDEHNKIVNTISVDSLTSMPGLRLISAENGGSIGDTWDGANYVSPATPPISPDQHNAPILAQLATIDSKSIRALREGDAVRIAALEAQAAALRSQLRKV